MPEAFWPFNNTPRICPASSPPMADNLTLGDIDLVLAGLGAVFCRRGRLFSGAGQLRSPPEPAGRVCPAAGV